MPRRRPEQPSDLPPEVAEAIAGMDLDQLRGATAQLLDLAGARARQQMKPLPERRRRRRTKEPFGVTVRVELLGAKPQVWRHLVLPSTLRLDQLHGVLQAVFDWTDSHLHRFILDEDPWGDGEKYLCPNDVEQGEDDGVPASQVRLDEVLAAPGDSLTYLYDYGDGWQHRLVVEESCPAVDDVRLLSGHGARATGGQRRHLGLGRRRRAALRPRRGPGRARRLEREPVGAARAARAAAAPGGSSHEAVLLELLAVAGLDRPIAVDDDVAETATARYRWLLHRVGAGVQLTAAGWLPPALVPEAMSALWPEDRWIGKRNREDLTEPVRRLRASAQRAGLVRISRGKLLPTKAGAALRNDPHRLFVHLAQRLAGRPGDTFARTATALVLVAVAAGRGHHDAVAELLTAAGWVTGGGAAVHPHALVHAAGDALEVLDVAGGWDDADWRNRVVTPAGRALAQAALLSTR